MNNRLQTRQGCSPNSCCHEQSSMSCGESMNYDQLQRMPLAMAYVPWQQWQNVYDGSKGLEHGTIFEELLFPFQHASRVCRNMGECRMRERERMCPREQCESIGHMERREGTMPYERSGQCRRTMQGEQSGHCERRCD